MGCLIAFLAFFFPRIVMLCLVAFTNWFSLAFETIVWPVLGWFFMPYTTLAYMYAMLCNNHTVSGGYLVLLIVTVIFDILSALNKVVKIADSK